MRRPFLALTLVPAITLAACTAVADAPPSPRAAPAPSPQASPPPRLGEPAEQTRILSEPDAQRLLNNKGVTLHWIGWDRRGSAHVSREDGLWHLRAIHGEPGGPGRLAVDGDILEIGEGYFTLRGTVRITDTPDRGRSCEETKTWHFAITQNRPYYRLREFEWCDYMTDYIDIYF